MLCERSAISGSDTSESDMSSSSESKVPISESGSSQDYRGVKVDEAGVGTLRGGWMCCRGYPNCQWCPSCLSYCLTYALRAPHLEVHGSNTCTLLAVHVDRVDTFV
jgi:hypothetical protein